MRRIYSAFVVVAAVVISCTQQLPGEQDPVHGAWRLVGMHLITADGKHIETPANESLFLFADGYYSIGYAFGKDGSKPYAERWHPSDAEKTARFSS